MGGTTQAERGRQRGSRRVSPDTQDGCAEAGLHAGTCHELHAVHEAAAQTLDNVSSVRTLDVDFLIVGTGVAGLYASLQLADSGSVAVVTKSSITDASTAWAQGGIAAVMDAKDTIESHYRDTMDAGAGLCDPDAVRILVSEGPGHVKKLVELGVNFDHAGDQYHLGREGGHSENRIVHSADFTGREIETALASAVKAKGIRVLEQTSVVELIMHFHLSQSGTAKRCYGAYVYDRQTWDITIIRAGVTILASGGAGQVYLHNTNPDVATGDGVALAYRAGAVISNMEFYQFHPTTLYCPGQRTFLISEAVRGHGAVLRGMDGEPFMQRYDERRDLAPRDICARAIDGEMKRTASQHVWLDITHKSREELMVRFPNIYAACLEHGIDMAKELVPVVPAAHYMCGGVRTDLNGVTAIDRLLAIGEVACTGVHGGNRLASNSLLEGLVFAGRAARYIKDHYPKERPPDVREWNKEGLENAEEWILVQHNLEEVKSLMWNYVGIVRSNLRLDRALRRITLLLDEVTDFYRRTVIQNKILELRNLTLVAHLIIRSALARKESRGLHYNTDYPESREPSHEYTNLQR
ncbi:MAG: L-aspartate oxidase [Spirochaetia bacterium]|nr:L-aspartate oxidase [Spirochaetia bacterium]